MFWKKEQPWETSAIGVTRFEQKRAGRRVRISIDRTGVEYEIKDAGGEVRFHTLYEEIDPQVAHVAQKNGVLQHTGCLFLVIAVVLLACSSVMASITWADGAFWALVGGACVGFSYLRRIAFSVMNTERGRMSVIVDERHDQILREINLRRVSTLRTKYLQIDHDNSPKIEMGKYIWLRRVGAITDVELSQFASMLQPGAPVRRPNQPPTISQN